jgi:DNA-directed RNA polymerase subunit RPC12/RpoP
MPAASGACPYCGGLRIGLSRRRGLREHLLAFLGVAIYRCRRCDKRFSIHPFHWSAWYYAHCPKCWGTNLSPYNERFVRPGRRQRIKMLLGAKPSFCNTCRWNFATFRPRRPSAPPLAGKAQVEE